MDLLQFGSVTTKTSRSSSSSSLWSRRSSSSSRRRPSSSSSSSSSSSPLKKTPPICSRKDDSSSQSPQNGDNNNNNKGRFSTDWDKAWSSFKKKGKKTLFSQFNPNKYVSWNPRRSEYPMSEEVDPIKKTERTNLMLWTSPKFTLAGAIVVVSLLLIYTLLAPMK